MAIFVRRGTTLNANQIRLTQIFSVERILASRGFSVKTEGNGSDTILPKEIWEWPEADAIFQIFDDPKKRAKLKIFADGNSQTDDDLVGLQAMDGIQINQPRYATTFEWYVGQLLVRKFGAFSSSYGVNISDTFRNSDNHSSGDFDVLSILGTMDILYVECKTGGFKAGKILNMIERSRALHALASIMFIEKNKPQFLRDEIAKIAYPGTAGEPGTIKPLKVWIKGKPESAVYQWHNAFFVPGDTPSINLELRFRTVLRLMACKHAEIIGMFGISSEDYNGLGYEASEL